MNIHEWCFPTLSVRAHLSGLYTSELNGEFSDFFVSLFLFVCWRSASHNKSLLWYLQDLISCVYGSMQCQAYNSKITKPTFCDKTRPAWGIQTRIVIGSQSPKVNNVPAWGLQTRIMIGGPSFAITMTSLRNTNRNCDRQPKYRRRGLQKCNCQICQLYREKSKIIIVSILFHVFNTLI